MENDMKRLLKSHKNNLQNMKTLHMVNSCSDTGSAKEGEEPFGDCDISYLLEEFEEVTKEQKAEFEKIQKQAEG